MTQVFDLKIVNLQERYLLSFDWFYYIRWSHWVNGHGEAFQYKKIWKTFSRMLLFQDCHSGIHVNQFRGNYESVFDSDENVGVETG